LFPHISAKVQGNIDQQVQKTFSGLHNVVNAVLDLVVSDVEMALASNPRLVDDDRNQEDPEVERRKGELMAEIRELKEKHVELLTSIANI
jgi:hypothetical protein